MPLENSTASIGKVAELWRYPVKGMRGERVRKLELDPLGVAGDRRFAFESSGAPRGKPLLTGAERAAMLRFAAAEIDAGVWVAAPGGARFHVDEEALLDHMRGALPGGHALTLLRSQRPLTDVRPVAVLGTATVAQLGRELGALVDARRFRANLLLDLSEPFAEDALVGRTLRIGGEAELRVTERDPRCRIVTLDPETAEPDPVLMKHLDRRHGGCVGVYATVAQKGRMVEGDAVTLVG